MTQSVELIRAKLNTETAKADWTELQPFFAKGLLIRVDSQLDLIDVAAHIACDRAETVKNWMTDGQLVKLEDAMAADWQVRKPAIWTVVVAPWILVQERAH
ncbi:MAG: DUF2288 domain-containing protein [Burkholderiales bacterium]